MMKARESGLKTGFSLSQLATAGFLTWAFATPGLADTPTDQRCAKADDVRLIEIRFADDQGSLPCKVIYRPASESDTLGIVSWQNIADVDSCVAQAKEVTDRLTEEGWACSTETAEGDARATNIAAGSAPGADGPAEPRPVGSPAEADLSSDSELEVATDAEREEFDEPAKFVDNPEIEAPSDDLVSLVQQDLTQLDTTLDGLLKAMIAGYGDLNGDDVDDALVLYTYNSPQPADRQFLAAYLFDGETYQLTATRPVSSTVSATMGARVETIDRGVIHLTLQAYEPGDESCCPSGTRDLALTLRDLDLVEVEADSLTR